jgi:hypothetical protein
MEQEKRFSLFRLEVTHEIRHCLTVNIIVTSYPTHVGWEYSLCLEIVSDELLSVQSLNGLGSHVQHNGIT